MPKKLTAAIAQSSIETQTIFQIIIDTKANSLVVAIADEDINGNVVRVRTERLELSSPIYDVVLDADGNESRIDTGQRQLNVPLTVYGLLKTEIYTLAEAKGWVGAGTVE